MMRKCSIYVEVYNPFYKGYLLLSLGVRTLATKSEMMSQLGQSPIPI